MSDTAAAIDVRDLRKRYGDFEAVRGIDISVRKGEVFGLLGPNGAGKTTTVEILEGYRARSGGEVSVLGCDPGRRGRELRQQIGIVLQSGGIYGHITPREALRHWASFYPHPRDVEEVIALAGLHGAADVRSRRLSGGQLRRLDFALALVGDPELIFLDEPTTGFDPSARRSAWDVIAGLRDLGKTIFLTTHYMDEAEHLADRIAVIAVGRVVAEGTPQTLGGRDRMTVTIRFTLPTGIGPRELPAGLSPLAERGPAGTTFIRSESPLVHVQMLAEWALGKGLDLPDL
ncbi:MAG TPA: ABC transporter ATP-binding protein, partial [Solirubrobacteraceae bacterium]|nr:ABC transporter ATP-binding protein [Solirubrobacteraceae bacterium]